MEVYTRTIMVEDKLTLVPFGDAHLGAKACDDAHVRRELKKVLDTQDAYIIGMGDYVDLITRQDLKRFSANSVSEAILPRLDVCIDAQKEILIETLGPLAKESKILGLLGGNHEGAILKNYSTDVTGEVCKALGAPYLGYSCLYRLHIKRRESMGRNLVIFAHHGFGGGKTMGAAINRRVNLIQDFEADIYLMGHDHALLPAKKTRLSMSTWGKPRLIAKTIIVAGTGSFLKGYQQGTTTYVERSGLSPATLGVPIIEVSFTGKREELEIHVSQ